MGYLRILEQAPLQMTKVVNFEQASSLDHISYSARASVYFSGQSRRLIFFEARKAPAAVSVCNEFKRTPTKITG